MIGRVNSGGGGANIRGIVEQYRVAAGENVSAGEFVRFVLGDNDGTDVQLNANAQSGPHGAAVLDSTHAIVAFKSSSSYITCVVVAFSGGSATVGTSTQISTDTNAYFAELVALDATHALIVYDYGSSHYLYGTAVTISGTTITAGTATQLNNNTYSGYYANAIALNSTRAYISHAGNSNNHLAGTRVEVSNRTITVTVSKVIVTTSNYANPNKAILLPDGMVFVLHNGSNNSIRGIPVTVTGSGSSAIVAGTDAYVSTTNNSTTSLDAAVLPDGRFVIFHVRSNKPYAMVASLSGSAVTLGTDTQISTMDATQGKIIAIDGEHLMVVRNTSRSDGTKLYKQMLTVVGMVVVAGDDVLVDDRSNTGASFDFAAKNGTGMIVYPEGTRVRGRLFENFYQAGAAVAGQSVNGLAKTGGSAGQMIDVYVPDV